MIDFSGLAAFVVTATLLTMVPGLDTATVLRSAAGDGTRSGIFTAVGVAIGCLCWGVAAAFGLGALMHAQPRLFDMVRWTGAIYLCWIGFRLLSNPGRAFVLEELVATFAPPRAALPSVRRGFLTNITNPKVGLFYLTLLPQFVPRGGGRTDAVVLACIHVAIALGWFVTLAILTGGIRPWLRKPSVMITLDRTTGIVFVLLALQIGVTTSLRA
jgi:threonine/homoserine/homoserine lactone efflux protein